MYPLVIMLLGFALVSLQMATNEPQLADLRQQVKGDVIAANFWAYHDALAKYQYENPSAATGTIAAAADQNWSYFDATNTGYRRSPLWNGGNPAPWAHKFVNGTLYTYSTEVLPPASVDAITTRGGRTVVIGIKQANGTMTSTTGTITGVTLPGPTDFTTGGIVVIGS